MKDTLGQSSVPEPNELLGALQTTSAVATFLASAQYLLLGLIIEKSELFLAVLVPAIFLGALLHTFSALFFFQAASLFQMKHGILAKDAVLSRAVRRATIGHSLFVVGLIPLGVTAFTFLYPLFGAFSFAGFLVYIFLVMYTAKRM